MKRILSLIIIPVMLLSFFTVSAEIVKEKNSQYAEEFLKMLHITSDDISGDNTVTRAEFTDMLLKTVNAGEGAYSERIFTDVTEGIPYSASISKAYEMGYINGSANGYFYPESPISADAALKMTVVALGYEEMAGIYGGYPMGYIRIANEIDLIKGVDISESFESADIYRLLYNFLVADVCRVTTVKSDGTATYERDKGNCPLTLYFDMRSEKGIVKTAGFISMLYNTTVKEESIFINGVSYACEIEDAEKYIGLNATVWIDEEDKVKAIYPERSKTEYVSAEEIDGVSENVITVFDEDSQKNSKMVLSPSYTFIKNGRCINPAASDFMKDGAKYTLVDNNVDGAFDVVIALIPEYMVVSSVNEADAMVYDNSGAGKHLLLNRDTGVNFTLSRVEKDGSEKAIGIDELQKDDVITYYRSDDKTYVKAKVCSLTESGIVTEVSRDSFVMGGKEYKANSYFGGVSSLAIGNEYTLSLSHDGTVIKAVQNSGKAMKYGFLVNFETAKEGLEFLTQIKILCKGNELLETELADRITLDGKENVKKDSSEITDKLKHKTNTDVTRYQVIRFSLDADGRVNCIDTAVEMDEKLYGPDTLIDGNVGDDILTRHLFKKKVFYYGSNKVLAPNAMIGTNTLFVSVPEGFIQDSGIKYEEEDFSIITSADLDSYETVEVTMYDIDKNFEPAVVMFYKGVTYSENAAVTKKIMPSIVKGVSKGMNAEGEITTIISYYQGSRAGKLPIDIEKNATLKAEDLPNPGDIIRFVENKDGEIANYVIDLRYTPKTGDKEHFLSTTENTLKGSLGNDTLSFGKAYYHTDTNLIIKILGGKASGHSYLSDLAAYKIGGGSVIIYDSTMGTAKPGTLSMLYDGASVGEESASLVAIKSYSMQTQCIFIYK